MAMQWMDDVRQTATLDEAEQLAVRLLQPPFESVRQAYAIIGFDATAFATELGDLVKRARHARAKRKVAQNRYEIEARQRRGVVDEVAEWLDLLEGAVAYARACRHPDVEDLAKDLFTQTASPESWSQGVDGMDPVLMTLSELGDLTKFGLPGDFHAHGVTLRDRLAGERDDAVFAESTRMEATHHLETLLDEIVNRFERIAAARELVLRRTGQELPGLELSLVKSAAASRARTAAEPAPASPTPSLVVTTPGPSDTGL